MERSSGVLRTGKWCKKEDDLLKACVLKLGEGNWHTIPQRSGLKRCRKSCRLRWLNYLKPNSKRGDFTEDEVDTVLKERIKRLKEKSRRNEMYTSESEFSEEMMDISKDLVTIHGQMVLLKNYSSLNLPLTRLVHECEANLELLFPLQAEVIQSAQPAEDQSKSPVDTAANTLPEASSTLGEETAYLYRSTLAAMRAIKGLQKASSTCDAFSFSTHFSSQDADSTDAVTVENSPANSRAAALWDGEDTDEEETYSV